MIRPEDIVRIEQTPEDFRQIIGNNIRRLRKNRRWAQKDLSQACIVNNVPLSQTMISNMELGKTIDLLHLYALSKVFKVSITQLISPPAMNVENAMIRGTRESKTRFITSPKEPEFTQYIDTFHTYFYQSNDPRGNRLVKGTLTFERGDGGRCKASMSLETGQTYTGILFFSRIARSAYCYLCNNEGDISFMIFSLSYERLNAWMASVVTVSSRNNKRPTAMRICISRKPNLTDQEKKYLEVHLKQNDNTIILSRQKLRELMDDESLPHEVREKLQQINDSSQFIVHEIPESSIVDERLSEYERLEYITYIRTKASAVNYNKIPQTVDQFVNDMIDAENTYLL